MTDYVLSFSAIDRSLIAKVGGKGANLGELTQAGFAVPEGFCITTAAYHAFVAPVESQVYARLEGVDPADLASVRAAGRAVRDLIAQCDLPEAVAAAITAEWHTRGAAQAYAVRSSATAEDLPTASFAGQQDTYLNVIGQTALLQQVKACFISLFTDRAILYRIQNGFSHQLVALSVVVQRMVLPEVSGILFTADPISENRNTVSIDASFGLGEALVSGVVSADLYKVDAPSGQIVFREVATKAIAVLPIEGGGTQTVNLPPDRQTQPALSDAQITDLAALGTRIQAHYGTPQDIEWAIAQGQIYVTQARPITSLFPRPVVADDSLHIFLSLSHLQVMTDAMPPMAISLWKYFPPIGLNESGEFRYLQDIGGRLFADVSPTLRHPIGRKLLSNFLGLADQLSQAAIKDLVQRPAFLVQGPRFNPLSLLWKLRRYAVRVPGYLLVRKTSGAPAEVLRMMDSYVRETQARMQDPTQDFAVRLLAGLRALRGLLPVAGAWVPKMIAGMVAQRMLHRLVGADNVALVTDIERGVVGNVVTDMNLAIGDLANIARLNKDAAFDVALAAFLAEYGARGPSEIDISRPRWREDPASLLHMIEGMAQHQDPGAHRRHYDALTVAGDHAAQVLPGRVGWLKRGLVRRFIRVSRDLMPLREHHKFLMVQVLAELKALMSEIAADFVQRKILTETGDFWFLTVPEVQAVLQGQGADLRGLVAERRAAFAIYARKAAPRILTSDGEIPRPSLSAVGAPAGALIGSPVSAGIFEGTAHVVRDPGVAILVPGEVLVAPFTDPGWTPLFVNAGALVTEVGGLMTHGSVVAREYGIPAVVGVLDATQKIKTGDRLRVNGDTGFVEILAQETP